ncbi:unnamed protein product [Rhizoctonia solani]|uniref:Uncharacterized protein n=1 Tax=Rhizoctonia solani TaxID=456999 RepID=A0A8H3E7R3_9AGAM|nr:unnamed protein product [Rhizoctonia solani]
MLGHHHQTLPVSHVIQSAVPISASEASAPVGEEPSPPKNPVLSCILRWYDEDAPGLLHLRNVDFKEFGNTLNELWKEGMKPRFDWDRSTGTVTIRSPSTFYEKAGVWVSGVLSDAINKKLEQVAICGRPFVVPGGSSEVMVGHSPQVVMEYRSRVQPDQSLYLLQADKGGKRVQVQRLAPRIVLENSGTESRQYAIEKAFKYLYETGGAVQAVIICHMTNMRLSTPKPFKAEMAVWRRKKTGDVDKDYPLEQCYHHGALKNHPTDHAFFGGSHSGTNTDTESNTACLVSDSLEYGGNFDPVAREYYRIDPNSGEEQHIYRESPGWIMVYDEDGPEPQEDPTIELGVYDILRVCYQRPNDYIVDRRITVPLKSLRRSLFLEVQAIRDPPTTITPTINIARVYPMWEQTGDQVPPKKKRRVENSEGGSA